jgi:hypothetical protein
MAHQFFLEHPSGLNEQTTVDGFVRNPHGVLRGKFPLEPACDLFGRPIQEQFAGNESLERRLCREPTALGPSGAIPSPHISLRRPIAVGSTMTVDFPADGRRGSSKLSGDLPE